MDVAKLFMNGRSQAVRLPRKYQFKGNSVWIKRMGEAIVLIPMENSWQTLLDSLDQFSEDFMAEREQPSEQQKREGMFP